MSIQIRAYNPDDVASMISIWNEVVEEGAAFPQEELLTLETGDAFFSSQTYCAVAEEIESKKLDVTKSHLAPFTSGKHRRGTPRASGKIERADCHLE